MNLKKLTIISTLLITNLITAFVAVVFYFGMVKNFDDLSSEETHFMEHSDLNRVKLKQFVLFENKGLNKNKFIEKYNINFNSPDVHLEKNSIYYKLLYFRFKDGVLYDIE